MKATWATFEDKVRDIAGLIWGKRPATEKVGGVDIDAVLHLDRQLTIIIEITEERKLGKIREDVTKLVTAQNALQASRVIARSYCVIDADDLTDSMTNAGKENGVTIITFADFSKQFFDFSKYRTSRLKAPFGSAINPITGERDDTEYVPVRYSMDGGADLDLGTKEIADQLKSGRHVILLGEYGSGKSRCIRETFRYLAERATSEFCHPLAIDLSRFLGPEAWY